MSTGYRTRRSHGGYLAGVTIVHSDAAALTRARKLLEQAVQVVGMPLQSEEVEHPAAGGAFIVIGRHKVQSAGEMPTVDELVEAIRAAARPRLDPE